MEGKLSECEPAAPEGGLCVCKGGPSLDILKDVQRAYEQRIELVNKAGGKNKLQKELELLRSWVGDLVEQNGLLARALEEMETEISSRVLLERRRTSEWDQKKNVRDKINELKLLNDTLQKENYTKEREIRKLSSDIQQCEQTIAALKKEITINRTVPTKDEEVMTEVCTPVAQCEDTVPEQDYEAGWGPHAGRQRSARLDLNHKSSDESMRATRKQNVELKEEVRVMSQLCGALYEQRHATQLRLQFKDDIIREMRRQLRQAKAKLELSKSMKPAQKTLSAEREDGSNAMTYEAVVGCVRHQPRRSRLDVRWECRSHDHSPDDTDSIKVD